MTAKTAAQCLTMLSTMDKKWNLATEDVFAAVLSDMEDEVGLDTVRKLLRTNTFAPSVAELLQAYAERISPYPPVEDAWREVNYKSAISNPAAWTHPIIGEAVQDMGGLNLIDHQLRWEQKSAAVVRAQFVKVYEARATQWREEVLEVAGRVGLEEARRQLPELFPVFKQRRLLDLPETREMIAK